MSRSSFTAGNSRQPYTPVVLPEHDLLCAMIESAMVDLHSPKWQTRKNAQLWFLKSTPNELFSFAWILRELGLDHLAVDIRKHALVVIDEGALRTCE